MKFLGTYLLCLCLVNFTVGQDLKKRIAKNKGSAVLYAELGHWYELNNQTAKAPAQYKAAIKHLSADVDSILALGAKFLSFGLYDWANAAYDHGNELLHGSYPFSMEKAEVFNRKGDFVGMINAYLDVLELGETYLASIQNALQLSFANAKDLERNQVIKSQLIKRIQSKPEKIVFEQLLVYILLQQHEYAPALIHVKALDNRLQMNGSELLGFAKICTQNQAYQVASKALQEVIDKGAESPYYIPAKVAILENAYTGLMALIQPSRKELMQLDADFSKELPMIGNLNLTLPLYIDYAHLKAFYLQLPEQGETILEEVLETPNLNHEQSAQAKLELGDIQLLNGKIWDASLTYSQVEKAFKYDVIGQEAKLRNARLAFYTNDFKWALAQANVLKASTTKLIANDAMALSVLISDNTGWDSIVQPLEIYARAELLAFQNKDSLAMLGLDSIGQLFPYHALNEYVGFLHADLAIKAGHYTQAEVYLKELIGGKIQPLFPDKALYKLGQLNETFLHQQEQAMNYFHDLLQQFPNSIYINEARKHFRNLRGDNSNP